MPFGKISLRGHIVTRAINFYYSSMHTIVSPQGIIIWQLSILYI